MTGLDKALARLATALDRGDEGHDANLIMRAVEFIDRHRAVVAASAIGGGQPMDTAPRDGKRVLLGFVGYPLQDWCVIGGSFDAEGDCWRDIYHGEVEPACWYPAPVRPDFCR